MTVTTTNQLIEIELLVPGMMCNGCAEKVRSALSAVSGVREVRPDLWRKRVLVRFEHDSVRESEIQAALHAAGFQTAAT